MKIEHLKSNRVLFVLIAISFAGCDQSKKGSDPIPRNHESSAKDTTMKCDWPFDDPENQAGITLDRIMIGNNPILYVTHDADDGGWQFLDGGDVSEEDAMVVSLRQITDHDATIKQLADLPRGWYAVRDAVGQPWSRHPKK